jgi:hypothetical protein
MPRPSHGRTDGSPVMVRLAPSEKEMLDAKAKAWGETRSGLLRTALAALPDAPGSTGNAIRDNQPALAPFEHETTAEVRELVFVRDEG